MINNKKLVYTLIMLLAFAFEAKAQYGTNGQNSPYTRYGFGQLSDQATGANSSMGGIGIGLRTNTQINAMNPASYSAVDSLTFLFDGGITLKNSNFDENGIKKNVKNSSLDYIVMQFRMMPRMGFTFGFMPYSTIGYNITSSSTLPNAGDYEDITSNQNYYGDGGLTQAFIGLGYGITKNLSVGFNAAYMFGDIKHSISNSFSQSSASANYRYYLADITSYKLDFGAQYTFNVNKKSNVTLGATYSLGHNMGSDAQIIDQKVSSSSVIESADTITIKDAFQLPHCFGVGITYNYKQKLTVGFDYTLQKFASAKFFGENDLLCDRSKYAFGIKYTPNYQSRNYLKRISYQAGAYYSEPYAKVDGKDGAKEYGVTAGFTLPIYKCLLNISGMYTKVSPKTNGLLKENRLGVKVGLTFNEAWFMKWKMQ